MDCGVGFLVIPTLSKFKTLTKFQESTTPIKKRIQNLQLLHANISRLFEISISFIIAYTQK
jgi:hypothetical protein